MPQNNLAKPGGYSVRFFRPGRSTADKIFRQVLGVCQICLHMFCRPRIEHTTGTTEKSFGECCGRTVVTAACCWPSSDCFPAQKFVSMSAELYYNRSPWVLDSDKGVAVGSTVCFLRTIWYLHPLDKVFNNALGRFAARISAMSSRYDTRVARWPVFHRPGPYFTANLAEAGKKPVFPKPVPEAGILKINNLQ